MLTLSLYFSKKIQQSVTSNLDDDDGAVAPLVSPPNPAGRVRLTLRYDADLEILEVTVDRAE